MKIASWNVNGLRAVHKKGFLKEFLEKQSPDICFFQEIKMTESQFEKESQEYPNYQKFYHSAQKQGYAGTAMWTKNGENFQTKRGIIGYADTEGRIISGEKNEWIFFGIYFLNGGKSSEAWKEKLTFYKGFLQHIEKLRHTGKKIIFCGDINCAQEEIDLARPKENKNSIGFLPEERAAIQKWRESGWKDVFRELKKDEVKYSWWAPYAKSRERNVGWRIDSFFIDENLLSNVKDIKYETEQQGSDHCPVMIELEMD